MGDTNKPRRPLTEAELTARRANAQLSSGTKDTSRTRFNGVSHGLTCKEPIVMEGEDPHYVHDKTQEYIHDLKARTAPERDALRLAVENFARCERGITSANEASAMDVAAVDDRLDDQFEGELTLDALLDLIPEQPLKALVGLRQISAGVRWMLDQVALLDVHLNTRAPFLPTQRVFFIHLIGRRPRDLFNDQLVMHWNLAYLSGLHGEQATAEQAARLFAADRPATMLEDEFLALLREHMARPAALGDQETGRALLRLTLEQARDELTRRLAVLEAREDRDRPRALAKPVVSVNHECMLLQRYLRENANGYKAAMTLFTRLKEMRLKDPEESKVEENEASGSGPAARAAAAPAPESAGEVVNRSEAGATQVVDGSEAEAADGCGPGSRPIESGDGRSAEVVSVVTGRSAVAETAGSGDPRRTVGPGDPRRTDVATGESRETDLHRTSERSAAPATGPGAGADPAREIVNRSEPGATQAVGAVSGVTTLAGELKGTEAPPGGAVVSGPDAEAVGDVLSQPAAARAPFRTEVRRNK